MAGSDYTAFEWADGGDKRLLLVADHASANVPPDIDLGIDPALMSDHIAVDIGVFELTCALARELDAPAWLGVQSRLVCDTNRPPRSPGLVPEESDGIRIPGNIGLTDVQRSARESIHSRYHKGLAAVIARASPSLLLSVHSFTPALRSGSVARPWPVGILWNQDKRAAEPIIQALRQDSAVGGPVGDNEPYSGRILNYMMDRHAEANGIPYAGFEIRQDQLADSRGVERWAIILARAIRHALVVLEKRAA